jgi:hypothetical protein
MKTQIFSAIFCATIAINVLSLPAKGESTELAPATYEARITNRVGTEYHLQLFVFDDGTMRPALSTYLDGYLFVSGFYGTATNRSSGRITGKFYNRGGRFRGRVNEDQTVTGIFWVPSDNGKRLLFRHKFQLRRQVVP